VAIIWGLAGLVIHLAIAAVFLARADGNPSWFVHFGTECKCLGVAKSLLGDRLLVPHVDGHDGQAFWLLAHDVTLSRGTEFLPRHVDRPVYRAQRIAYPALASPWLLLGEESLLWGLLATNLVVAFAGTWLAARFMVEVGAPPAFSLAFALCPGVTAATTFDFADALALAALMGALVALQRKNVPIALAFGGLAVLSKEAMLLGLLGISLLAPSLKLRTRVLVSLVPAALGCAWGLYIRWRLGWPPTLVQEFTIPFGGYVEAYRRGWQVAGNWNDAVLAVSLVPFCGLILRDATRRRSLLLAAAVPFAAMLPFLSGQVLSMGSSSLRAVSPAICFWLMDMPLRDAVAAAKRRAARAAKAPRDVPDISQRPPGPTVLP
jgi:hypothetical protein